MEENTKRINDVYDYLIYRHIINGQEDMANALKTSRPNITSMLSGKKSVTTETLRKISEAFPNIFSLKWLLTGELPMFIDDPFKTSNTSKPDNVIDQSSLINAALAAKDELIAAKQQVIDQLNHRLEEKDELISELRARIADLQRIATLTQPSDPLRKYPFEIGVAESEERPRL